MSLIVIIARRTTMLIFWSQMCEYAVSRLDIASQRFRSAHGNAIIADYLTTNRASRQCYYTARSHLYLFHQQGLALQYSPPPSSFLPSFLLSIWERRWSAVERLLLVLLLLIIISREETAWQRGVFSLFLSSNRKTNVNQTVSCRFILLVISKVFSHAVGYLLAPAQ